MLDFGSHTESVFRGRTISNHPGVVRLCEDNETEIGLRPVILQYDCAW
jgi:hypothetical protein